MVKIIRSTTRLYRSPEIKLKSKKRSHVFETIPILSDEKKQKELGRLDTKWEMRFFELTKYKRKYGHCNVPKGSKAYGVLATWCHVQRRAKKHHPEKYDSGRLHKLNEIGFRWNLRDEDWDKKFEQLKQYKAAFGHCNITYRNKNNKYNSLHRWISCQRKNYKEKKAVLTIERIDKLNSLGFLWKSPNPPPQPVSNEELLNDLQRLHKELSRIPSVGDIVKYGKHSYQTYQKRFVNIKIIREKSGFEGKISPKVNITDTELLNDLRQLYQKSGKIPSSKDIAKYGKYNYKTYQKRFGSIMNAREEAGINGRIYRITNTELLNDLQRLRRELSKIPSTGDIIKYGKYSTVLYQKRFGNILAAKKKAEVGGRIYPRIRITATELLNDLKRLHRELAKIPSCDDINKYGKYSGGTYLYRFGSIIVARERAGLVDV